jgi:hypothetical protein
MEETDRQDRQSLQDWWKKFHIRKAIHNTENAWNEMPQACMNGVRRRLHPDIVHKSSGFENHFPNDISETSHIADEAGIVGVYADDVE